MTLIMSFLSLLIQINVGRKFVSLMLSLFLLRMLFLVIMRPKIPFIMIGMKLVLVMPGKALDSINVGSTGCAENPSSSLNDPS